MPSNKSNKTLSFTNYKNILDVDYKNPTLARLFMYDVEDGFYNDDFFSINNINPNKPEDLNKFINVLDIADQLQSCFATSKIIIQRTGFEDTVLKAPDVSYKATCIVRDIEDKKIVLETAHDSEGFPIRHYQTEAIKPDFHTAKMQSITTNIEGRLTTAEVTSFSVKPGAELGTGEIKYYHKGRRNPMADVNPTYSFHLKQQIRQSIAYDNSIHQTRELISLHLVKLQREEKDGNGNIIKPLIPPVRIEKLLVTYNFEIGELELSPENYQLITNSALQVGASPKYNPTSAIMLEMQARLNGEGDNDGTKDIWEQALELVKEKIRTRNTSKTLNEKGEEIPNKK